MIYEAAKTPLVTVYFDAIRFVPDERKQAIYAA